MTDVCNDFDFPVRHSCEEALAGGNIKLTAHLSSLCDSFFRVWVNVWEIQMYLNLLRNFWTDSRCQLSNAEKTLTAVIKHTHWHVWLHHFGFQIDNCVSQLTTYAGNKAQHTLCQKSSHLKRSDPHSVDPWIPRWYYILYSTWLLVAAKVIF